MRGRSRPALPGTGPVSLQLLSGPACVPHALPPAPQASPIGAELGHRGLELALPEGGRINILKASVLLQYFLLHCGDI